MTRLVSLQQHHHLSYLPGDTVVHMWGETAGVRWAAGTWMVDY